MQYSGTLSCIYAWLVYSSTAARCYIHAWYIVVKLYISIVYSSTVIYKHGWQVYAQLLYILTVGLHTHSCYICLYMLTGGIHSLTEQPTFIYWANPTMHFVLFIGLAPSYMLYGGKYFCKFSQDVYLIDRFASYIVCFSGEWESLQQFAKSQVP